MNLKKALSAILVLALMLSVMPMATFAAATDSVMQKTLTT